MSSHDRKQRSIRIPSKSPIATPPRAALQGRSSRLDPKNEEQTQCTSSDAMLVEPEPSKRNNVPENGEPKHIDKDDRIAYLEKEMAVMEGEFFKELEQHGEKLTNEKEMVQSLQQKYSALNQQFLQTDADLRVLRYENANKDRQREDRDREFRLKLSSLAMERDTMRGAYHANRTELQRKEEEIVQLRSQIKGLKDFVSMNSRTDGQVTDEVFAEMMQKLSNGLQNWVIQHFRKIKIDLSKTDKDMIENLIELVPTCQSQVVAGKIHMIQSLVSRLLVDSIFGAYFIGLPESRATELKDLEEYMLSFTKDPVSVNQWRALTLSTFRRGSAEVLQAASAKTEETIKSKINNILSAITVPEDQEVLKQSSEARNDALSSLITSAIDLSRLLRVQKAVFRPFMPIIEAHQITKFDSETMEDIGGEDEDGLEGREVSCVTFPGIIKQGDESGQQAQLINVIAKARVLCSPD